MEILIKESNAPSRIPRATLIFPPRKMARLWILLTIFRCFIPSLLAQTTDLIKTGDFILVEIGPSEREKERVISQKCVVGDTGKIKLPGLKEEIPAAGGTPAKLAENIQKMFPHEEGSPVPVIHVTFPDCAGETHIITVGGEVVLQGELPFRKDLRLLGAITKSGGFSKFANRSRIKLISKNGKVSLFDLHEIKADNSNNPILEEGDVIVVPH